MHGQLARGEGQAVQGRQQRFAPDTKERALQLDIQWVEPTRHQMTLSAVRTNSAAIASTANRPPRPVSTHTVPPEPPLQTATHSNSSKAKPPQEPHAAMTAGLLRSEQAWQLSQAVAMSAPSDLGPKDSAAGPRLVRQLHEQILGEVFF